MADFDILQVILIDKILYFVFYLPSFKNGGFYNKRLLKVWKNRKQILSTLLFSCLAGPETMRVMYNCQKRRFETSFYILEKLVKIIFLTYLVLFCLKAISSSSDNRFCNYFLSPSRNKRNVGVDIWVVT